MPVCSLSYIDTLPEELDLPNGFAIPVCNELSVDEVQKEIREILEDFFPEFSVSESSIKYACFAAFPSWMGLSDGEELFANFQIQE